MTLSSVFLLPGAGSLGLQKMRLYCHLYIQGEAESCYAGSLDFLSIVLHHSRGFPGSCPNNLELNGLAFNNSDTHFTLTVDSL